MALILTAKNFILISKFYQKISCAIWTVCAPALEGIFYNFNSHKPILTSKANQSVIYILLMTFSWYGSNQRTNLNCSSIKITIPWVFDFKYSNNNIQFKCIGCCQVLKVLKIKQCFNNFHTKSIQVTCHNYLLKTMAKKIFQSK